MLVELSVMEQPYQAVLAVAQDGWKVTEVNEVAESVGVSPERPQLDRALRARRLSRTRGPFAPTEHLPASDRCQDGGPDLREAS